MPRGTLERRANEDKARNHHDLVLQNDLRRRQALQRCSVTETRDLPPARPGEPEQRLLFAPAIGNNAVAHADRRGESRAIRQGSYRDVREGEQG